MFRQYYKTMVSQIQPDENLLMKTKNKIRSSIEPKGMSRMRITRLGAAAACLVVVVAAAAVFQLGQPKAVSAANGSSSTSVVSSSDPVNSGIQTALQSGHNEEVVQLSNGVLNFTNPNSPATSAKMFFDPETTHQEEWAPEKVVKYLGKDVRPGYLPEVFTKTEQTAGKTNQFIIMNNDGTVNYDNISYFYNGNPDDAAAPSLAITVSKGKLPRDCVMYRSSDQTQSNINGHKLFVGYEQIGAGLSNESSEPVETYDRYYSEFLYDGIGYRVVSDRLSQEEFVKVLLSIVK